MPVVYGQSAWVDLLSERVEREVARAAGLPADSVFLFLGRPELLTRNPPADRFVSLAPAAMPVDPRLVAGAGAEHTAFDSAWDVNVFCRLATDQEFRHARLLRDRSRGLGELVRKVCVGLQLDPLADDALAASPLREPMRLAGVTWNPRDPEPGWGWAKTTWQAKFRADLRA